MNIYPVSRKINTTISLENSLKRIEQIFLQFILNENWTL